MRTRKHAGRGRHFGEEEHVKINIELDKALEETEVLIRAAKMTEEVNGILKKLEEPSMQMISGFAGDTLEILEQAEYYPRIRGKRKSLCGDGKGRISASDAALRSGGTAGPDAFRTVSNSEIINLKMAKSV